MVHGNPTSSHLYRHFVEPLVDAGYRAVAPDHLGFGASPKAGGELSVAAHAGRFADLMDGLELDDVTLVLHDWGGPIALRWATRNAERVKRLVVLNTVGWAPPRRTPPLAYRILGAPALGELLTQRLNAVVRVALLRRLPQRPIDDPQPYLSAHRNAGERAAILALIRAVPDAMRGGPTRAFLDSLDLEPLREKPALIAWGMRDPILKPSLIRRWREALPRAEAHELDAGHFVQEDAHEELVPLVLDFLGRTP
jgi:haloalkane dehalogenase